MNSPPENPEPVNPSTISLFVPFARQYGIAVIFAGVFACAVERVYSDFKEQSEILISIVREQTSASRESADALRELVDKIGHMTESHAGN